MQTPDRAAGGASPVEGVRRKVDDLGRVVIPAPMRRALGLEEGEAVEIRLEGDRVVLVRAADRCTFCSSEQHLELLHGKPVCFSCLAALRRKAAAAEAAAPPAGAAGTAGAAGADRPDGLDQPPASSTAW